MPLKPATPRQIISSPYDLILFNAEICHDNGRKNGVFLINGIWKMALLLLAYPPLGTEKVLAHVLHVFPYLI